MGISNLYTLLSYLLEVLLHIIIQNLETLFDGSAVVLCLEGIGELGCLSFFFFELGDWILCLGVAVLLEGLTVARYDLSAFSCVDDFLEICLDIFIVVMFIILD